MTPTIEEKTAGPKALINALAETIRETPHAIPQGHLFATLLVKMPAMTADQFFTLITLVQSFNPDIKTTMNDMIYSERNEN